MPLMAEWTRGSAGVPSGLSIGFTPDGAEHEPQAQDAPDMNTAAPGSNAVVMTGREQQKSIAQSQFATMITGSQDRDGEEVEEGSVQVQAAEPANAASNRKNVKRRLSNEDVLQQAMSSADAQVAELDTAHAGNHSVISNVATRHLKRNDSVTNGDFDSLSAVSKAVREDSLNQHADNPIESNHKKTDEGQAQDPIKPTESLSSAAAGVFPGSYAAAIATAASLVSQNTGKVMAKEDKSLRKSISGEVAIDTNDAIQMLHAVGATPHMKSPRVGADRAAQSANQRIPSRMAPATVQQVPGNSSNSGNHQVALETYQNHLQGSVTLHNKRNKSFSSSKPPMRPPPKTAAAAIAAVAPATINTVSGGRGVNVALPTGSSSRAGGIHIHFDQLAHMAEDAVSTVQQHHEILGEVACDAVSKASADAHGEDDNNGEFTESAIQHGENGTAVSRRVTRAMTKRLNNPS